MIKLFFFFFFFSYTVSSYDYVEKNEKNFYLILKAISFSQGNVTFLKLNPKIQIKKKVQIVWNKKIFEILYNKKQNILFLPIPPNFNQKYIELDIISKDIFPNYKFFKKSYKISISKTKFFFTRKRLKVKKKYTTSKLSKNTLDFIRKCSEIKKKIFKINSQNKIFSSFVSPVKRIKLTSKFYSYRLYNNRIKSRPHGGTDFKGKVGEPIYAVQDGKILIAQKMYYEGNFTVIDHGNQFFSLYMHQSKILVKKNQFVRKGQLIGKIGSTGRVTGPHLHLGMKNKGVLVDPMSVLNINFFKVK